MDYQSFKECVRLSGLGIKDFARHLGLNHKSVSNYSSRGVVPDHLALIALMLMELKRHNIPFTPIFSRVRGNADTPPPSIY